MAVTLHTNSKLITDGLVGNVDVHFMLNVDAILFLSRKKKHL